MVDGFEGREPEDPGRGHQPKFETLAMRRPRPDGAPAPAGAALARHGRPIAVRLTVPASAGGRTATARRAPHVRAAG